MTTILTPMPVLSGAGACPTCHRTFENCLCTGLAPRAGTVDDIRREDDSKGFERDETDQFHQLVEDLVADGDNRARAAGRRARRTLAEMAPGYDRQPVLQMVGRPLTFRAADDACVLCGYWTCRCGSVAPAPALVASSATGASR